MAISSGVIGLRLLPLSSEVRSSLFFLTVPVRPAQGLVMLSSYSLMAELKIALRVFIPLERVSSAYVGLATMSASLCRLAFYRLISVIGVSSGPKALIAL